MSPGRRRGGSRSYRYGAYLSGRDPLAPPFDVQAAVDSVGDKVLAGESLRDALRDLLRSGDTPGGGLDDLAARARRRRRDLMRSGQLDAGITAARAQLDQALATEQEALAGQPGEEADFARTRLDALPRSTAAALRELADYEWVSPEAKQLYDNLAGQLRQQLLDQQLGGLRQSLGNGQLSPDQSAAMREMLTDLSDLLGKHATGQDTTEDFENFMAKHGQNWENPPGNVEELIEELARRAAAMDQLMRSLPDAQRDGIMDLVRQMLEGTGLDAEMARLTEQLRGLRPDLFGARPGRLTGQEPLGFEESASVLGQIADLDSLLDQLDQQHLGTTLDAIDVEQVERSLGRAAADQVRRLAELERALRDQGWLSLGADGLTLSPKALRRIGATALRRVFADLDDGRRGDHDVRQAGAAGENTGASAAWELGDTRPFDAVRTVSNALLRTAQSRPGEDAAAGRVELAVEDFAVVETEKRSGAAVALCVDLSYSMYAEDRWGPMKQTALALAHLVATRYRQDALTIIGFGRYAQTLTETELAAVEPDFQQGTNLSHALALAGRHLRRHSDGEPVVLVVTDGEPTAHLSPDGEALFCWPPHPDTIEATITEVDHLTRYGATLNIVMLGDDPRLRRFVDAVAQRSGGRVLLADPDNLGEFVISDYLRARRGRR